MYSSPVFWILLFLGIALVFVLPTIIAIIRRSEDLPLVIGLNALGLVLPVFGWLAAVGFAFFSLSKRPSRAIREARTPVSQVPVIYDPGRFRGTPFEAAARRGLWAEYSPSKR